MVNIRDIRALDAQKNALVAQRDALDAAIEDLHVRARATLESQRVSVGEITVEVVRAYVDADESRMAFRIRLGQNEYAALQVSELETLSNRLVELLRFVRDETPGAPDARPNP
jgi:vancomycin resistance protein YoaR